MTTSATSRIYLDYNASTPLAPCVAAKMREVMEDAFGNPSSPHWAGAPARVHVEHARTRVAELLGCAPSEIVFTSGGSEANNFALKGVFFARAQEIASPHIITTAVEHPAIVAPCEFLARLGARITALAVDGTGCIDPDDLRRAMTPDTVLVSVMHANNEVGTILPIEACSAIAREHGVAFHTDAAQSVGKIPTRVDDLGVDLLSIAGHKIHAPKGIGALYARAGTKLEPLVHGAGHEHRAQGRHRERHARRRAGRGVPVGRRPLGDGANQEVARQVLVGPSAAIRRWSRPQRPPGVASAEHPQRLVRRKRGREGARPTRRSGGVHRIRVSLGSRRASPRSSPPCRCRSTLAWARCGSASGAAPAARKSTP